MSCLEQKKVRGQRRKEGREGMWNALQDRGKTGEISEQQRSQQGSFRLCAGEVALLQARPRSRSPLDLQTKPR